MTTIIITPNPLILIVIALIAVLIIQSFLYLERNHEWVLVRFEKVVKAIYFVCIRCLFMFILIMVCAHLFQGMMTIF